MQRVLFFFLSFHSVQWILCTDIDWICIQIKFIIKYTEIGLSCPEWTWLVRYGVFRRHSFSSRSRHGVIVFVPMIPVMPKQMHAGEMKIENWNNFCIVFDLVGKCGAILEYHIAHTKMSAQNDNGKNKKPFVCTIWNQHTTAHKQNTTRGHITRESNGRLVYHN